MQLVFFSFFLMNICLQDSKVVAKKKNPHHELKDAKMLFKTD